MRKIGGRGGYRREEMEEKEKEERVNVHCFPRDQKGEWHGRLEVDVGEWVGVVDA